MRDGGRLFPQIEWCEERITTMKISPGPARQGHAECTAVSRQGKSWHSGRTIDASALDLGAISRTVLGRKA